MKLSIVLLAGLLSMSCSNSGNQDGEKSADARPDTVIIHDTIREHYNSKEWQKGFGLTHDPDRDTIAGKPVTYYIDDSSCAGLARDFYYGTFRPADDGATSDLLALATTEIHRLRPFYRWCLDRTIDISDGALGELTGVPARRYAEKFPQEFIDYVERDEQRRREWIAAISYSGFYDSDEYNKPIETRQQFESALKKNCRNCDAGTIARLERFAQQCFE